MAGALQRTGIIESAGALFLKAAGKNELRALLVLAVVVLPLSALVNNTPVVVVFLPILVTFARETKHKVSRLLIPLSYLSILGGTTTLIGTSTNILVSAQSSEHGQPAFGIFEITGIGVIYALVGSLFLFTFGRKLLPSRETLSSLMDTEDSRGFSAQAVVLADSPLIGIPLGQTIIGKSKSAQVYEVQRFGIRLTDMPTLEHVCVEGDTIVFSANARGISEIQATQGLDFLGTPDSPTYDDDADLRSLKLFEAIIGKKSAFVGKTIRKLATRRRFGVVVAAVHRKGTNLFENFQDVPLGFGDTLILEGPDANIQRLQQRDDFLSLSDKVTSAYRKHKAPLAIGAILAVVILAASNLLPIASAAMIGAAFVIVTNNAVAIIMPPLVIGLASNLQVDPRPFLVAVMFGASASFATPIGYQTNTYVYGAGGYKFSDFLRIGVPLNILLAIVAIIFIPLFFPF